MPLYSYEALDPLGKKRTGLIEAQTEKEAKEKLRSQGTMLKKLALRTTISKKQNLKGDVLLAFTLQLSQLVSAGVPLYESLLALEEQYRTDSCHRVVLSLCEQIKAGQSLSQSMGNFPDSFDQLYCSMITAGEAVGALDIVLDKLSQLLQKQNKLKKQIITAMVYPAILAAFSFLIILMLLGFVVPSIEGIFVDRQLNGFTEFVLGMSRGFRSYWWIALPSALAGIIYLVHFLRSLHGRLWLERNMIKFPLLKTLIIQTCVARFCRTMGTLQQGGLPVINSLRISREVMHNVVLEEEVKKAEAKIIEGSSLSAELMHSRYIPKLVPRMLAVGEESGNATAMFNKVADIYENEIEKSLERVMALAQPVILIVMGTIIGVVLLAILLPLTDVSSLTM
ncbi:type II secretion system F family protein [Neochlamydia sp. AcF95]|uniref:type II secretion system F family protein n=1 Tax=Neochlamydia sp. AcF95 TaxID=2795734 RepID=UPI001BCA4DAE|nr:type II secretion system F family protein [Neochlamydia sp. AcF95]MBS4169405.1 Type II secretion system protein F [Neochlamydia sp. AcF95]